MNNTNYDEGFNNNKTKLDKKYSFWYRISEEALLFSKFVDTEEYENQVKKIADFDTVFFYKLTICTYLTFFRWKIFGLSFNI